MDAFKRASFLFVRQREGKESFKVILSGRLLKRCNEEPSLLQCQHVFSAQALKLVFESQCSSSMIRL